MTMTPDEKARELHAPCERGDCPKCIAKIATALRETAASARREVVAEIVAWLRRDSTPDTHPEAWSYAEAIEDGRPAAWAADAIARGDFAGFARDSNGYDKRTVDAIVTWLCMSPALGMHLAAERIQANFGPRGDFAGGGAETPKSEIRAVTTLDSWGRPGVNATPVEYVSGDVRISLAPPSPAPPVSREEGAGCRNLSPPGFSGHWRDWHRGHGCALDPSKQTPETRGGGR